VTYATGHKFVNLNTLPHIGCAGCGFGIVAGALVRAYEELDFERRNIAMVMGIGCSGTIDRFITTNTLHATHGRALAFATGIKAANPKLNVVCFVGDGDGATIGGNHLIHAARRNIGITVIVVNNMNYGMTGGQVSATTPLNAVTNTTKFGNPEQGFDLCELTKAAGANFVARDTAISGMRLKNKIKQALLNPGFSLLDVICPCTTIFGPNNKLKTPVSMFEWLQEKGISASKYDKIENASQQGYFKVGVFKNDKNPSYNERYEAVRKLYLAAGEGK
jgi:2-oxoglutarate ferredoxin oxidoreductase subunit beta